MAEVAQPEAEQEASSGKIRAPFRADIEFMDEFGGAVFPGLDRGLRAGREFYSVAQLVASMEAYMAERDLSPKRYVWKADGHAILKKIAAARAALQANVPSR